MSIPIDQIESRLAERGYRVIHETLKKRGFQLGDQLPVYLNLQSKSGETALVAHPESGVDRLRNQRPDLHVGGEFFHSSNMRHFPKRLHTGRNPICYGWGLTFDSLSALDACLDHLARDLTGAHPSAMPGTTPPAPDQHGDPTAVPAGADLPVTATRRVGHDQFRDALLAYWGGCAVTGFSSPRLLRASHIKPWVTASAEEKTDPFNGLLLAPQLDAAFDAGLIAFDDEGKVLVSPQLSASDATLLGLKAGLRLRQIDARHRPYLAFHREVLFSR